MSEKALAIFKEAPPKSKVSSTKSAWLITYTLADEVMSGTIPSIFPAVNFLLKVLAIRIYKNDESG